MTRFEIVRNIDAPASTVFNTFADVREYKSALPHVIECEILSENERGIGARYRETRLMSGKEEKTEVEVTEYVEDERIRMVADSNGAIWDTLFTVAAEGDQSVLTMTMDAKPYKLFAKVTILLFGSMIRKGLEKDMDLFKEHCEGKSS